MSLGEQLRSAREGKGLSISDIARITFIRAHYLESIEQDDFSSIPHSRLRYFIQDYAKSVDLDPSALLKNLPDIAAVASSSPVVPAVSSPSRSAPSSFIPKAKEEPVQTSREFGEESEDTPPPTPLVSAPSSEERPGRLRRKRPRYTPLDQGNPALVRGLMTVALLLLIGLGIYFLTGGFEKSGSDQENVVVAADTGAGNDVRILSRSEGVADTNAAAEEVTESGDSLVLQGRAIAQVWYSIKMDNRQETGTLDSGEVKVWKAEKEFRVALGNAGGLEFSLNGKPLGALGPKGKALRPKTIDAQGVRGLSNAAPRARTSSAASRPRAPRRAAEENTGGSRLRRLESTEPRRAVTPE